MRVAHAHLALIGMHADNDRRCLSALEEKGVLFVHLPGLQPVQGRRLATIHDLDTRLRI